MFATITYCLGSASVTSPITSKCCNMLYTLLCEMLQKDPQVLVHQVSFSLSNHLKTIQKMAQDQVV